ncbi:MAG: hypothetical protein WBC04_07400, partial [Candidatus Acidiferrales bacterium]
AGLENPFRIFTFPQPRRRRVFGYITNGATIYPRVTFFNGLTRSPRTHFVVCLPAQLNCRPKLAPLPAMQLQAQGSCGESW